jgi:hypothetical protein
MTETTLPPLLRIGSNSMAMHEDGAATLERELLKLAKIPDGVEMVDWATELTELQAAQIKDLGQKAHEKVGELDLAERAERKEFEDEIARIKGLFRPLSSRAESVKVKCRSILTAYLSAQQRKRELEAAEAIRKAKALEDEALATKQAAAQSGHVFDAMDAEDAEHAAEVAEITAHHAQQMAAARPSIGSLTGFGRAASLRVTWSAKAIDGPKLVRHYAKRAEMIEAALKLASAEMRATKGQAVIPGAEAVSKQQAV